MKLILSLILFSVWKTVTILGESVYIWDELPMWGGPKLSTSIDYAIYSVSSGRYLNGRDSTSTAEVKLTSGDPSNDAFLQWRIEKVKYTDTQYFYALKSKSSGNYLCFDAGKVWVINVESAWTYGNCQWKFVITDGETVPNLPNLAIKGYETNYYLDGRSSDDEPRLTDRDPTYDRFLQWVIIAQSIPESCESVSSSPSNPEIFNELSLVIDNLNSITVRNSAPVSTPLSTAEKEICQESSNTFTRTSGAEYSYSFKVSYAAASAETEWTYSSSTEESTTTREEICITMPSTEYECPARTICERQIIEYKPPSDKVSVTITAICDKEEYITYGQVSINGAVEIHYQDIMTPMDCEFYTTDYGDIGAGFLPFCDTCLNNKQCEICRDYYVLLDGQCITPSVCEYICGGQVKGDGADGVLDAIPWSGAWCHITAEGVEKYNTPQCAQETGRNL